jgi:Sulfotransferase family
MTQTPLFVLSLPRSGSTLVQRVLAAHDEVSTAPEPWVILPQVYAMRERGAFAEYGQVPAARALREFAQRLPGGEQAYREELRRFLLSLYETASGGRGAYFLDKTPRYHFVIEDLFRIFPDAKYVFLWRNPLSVVSSIVETWAGGAWTLERWHGDLFDGLARLVEGFERHADASCVVCYEDLVGEPEEAWRKIFDYLDLSFDPDLLRSFAEVDLAARMGDRTGSRDYASLRSEPVVKWRDTITNPLRKRWCRNYLDWIGERRLTLMGYDLSGLLRDLEAVPDDWRGLGSDLLRGSYRRTSALRRDRALRTLTRGRGGLIRGRP